jgi:hypothetical protein
MPALSFTNDPQSSRSASRSVKVSPEGARKARSRAAKLVERFAQLFAERIAASLPRGAPSNGSRNGLASKLRGLKRDMRCRYPGCKNRSKGPRFRYLREEHLKLPKKKQDEALAKWEERSKSG